MIREFWAEQKEERRQRKIQKKQGRQLTKLEKTQKISGILVIIVLVVIFFATNCSGAGNIQGINWGKTLGISDEYMAELEKPVDENILFPMGKLDSSAWASFVDTMKSNNQDIFNEEGELDNEKAQKITLAQPINLDNRQVGAIAIEMNKLFGVGTLINICDFQIYKENGRYYEKNIVYVDLENLITDSDLPSVYLTTIAEVKILGNELKSLSYKVSINNLSVEKSSEILEVLNKFSNNMASRIATDSINSYIYLFFEGIGVDFALTENGIQMYSQS